MAELSAMMRAFVSVGFWTLVSRATGFIRDILLANVLGAGLLMDAFTVAFRLPNHFRAIFAEGAFNTAFVPAFTRIRASAGATASDLFQGRILGLVLASQLVLLTLVLSFTPGFVRLLAPGFADRPDAMALAIDLTRIIFPYLALITLVVLWSGVLNAEKRFFEGAAAPVLLNIAMISTLLAGSFFTTYAHAAAYGVLVAGFLEAGLLAWGARRAGLLAPLRLPSLDPEVQRFFKAFGPAVIGAAGVQIAMLADTIIVTFLPQGGASSLYYADRLYQLPVGVIGVAAGTVLLPEMSRLIAEGKDDDAHRQQNRAITLSWLIAAPFLAGFLLLPDLIVAAFFQRGAFSAEATRATANVL
ncbi:MAG TPA: murein biosynthesis integral membrane protein MurJ, partial [Rhabdaerophilum sp.]|nr:murein biosynthesis integral membrane protein MurJ [Rhabdaerophilum sp.]